MSNNRCENCVFFDPESRNTTTGLWLWSKDKGQADGVCRRHAPAPQFDRLWKVWPQVSRADWCGEIRLRRTEPLPGPY